MVDPGDVVFFGGHVLHRSHATAAPRARGARSSRHYCNARSWVPWNDEPFAEGESGQRPAHPGARRDPPAVRAPALQRRCRAAMAAMPASANATASSSRAVGLARGERAARPLHARGRGLLGDAQRGDQGGGRERGRRAARSGPSSASSASAIDALDVAVELRAGGRRRPGPRARAGAGARARARSSRRAAPSHARTVAIVARPRRFSRSAARERVDRGRASPKTMSSLVGK